MPYVKMAECVKRNRSIVAAIKYGMSQQDVSADSIAKAINKDRTTFYRRLKNPGDFTLSELWIISAKVRIPIEKLIRGETQ